MKVTLGHLLWSLSQLLFKYTNSGKKNCRSSIYPYVALKNMKSLIEVNRNKHAAFTFQDMAIHLLNNESEAIVRKEAVILMKELYIHYKWP